MADQQPRLPGVEDPKAQAMTWVWRNPNKHSGKVHRLYHEDAEKTACGVSIGGCDPIEIGFTEMGAVTCRSCKGSEDCFHVLVVMHVPKSADANDLQQAADFIRENGVIPDWLREHVATAIASAIPKTPAWVIQPKEEDPPYDIENDFR